MNKGNKATSDKNMKALVDEVIQKLKEEHSIELEALRKETEEKFIESEVRPFRVVQNLVKFWRPEGEVTTGMSKSSKLAFFNLLLQWLLFSKKMAIAGGGLGIIGGLVALGTLWFNMRSLNELTKQNEFIEQQNNQLVAQNAELIAQGIQSRRSDNVSTLANLLSDLENYSPTMDNKTLMQIRIYTVAESLVPYQAPPAMQPLIDGNDLPELFSVDSTRLISPERGALLRGVLAKTDTINQEPNPNFSFSYLPHLLLSNKYIQYLNVNYSVLPFANLMDCNLRGLQAYDSDLRYFSCTNCELGGADFRKADLYLGSLSNCNLGGAMFKGAYLDGVQFYDCDNLEVKELCKAKSLRGIMVSDSLMNLICTECPELLEKNTTKLGRDPLDISNYTNKITECN